MTTRASAGVFISLLFASWAASPGRAAARAGFTRVEVLPGSGYVVPGSWANAVTYRAEPWDYKPTDGYVRLEVRDRAGALCAKVTYPADDARGEGHTLMWYGKDDYGSALTEAGSPYTLTVVLGDGNGEVRGSTRRALREWYWGILIDDAPETPDEWESGTYEPSIVSELPFGTPANLEITISRAGERRRTIPYYYVVADYGKRATGCVVGPRLDPAGSFYILYTTAASEAAAREAVHYDVLISQRGEGVTDVADNPWDMDETTEVRETNGRHTFAVGPEGDDIDFREEYWR